MSRGETEKGKREKMRLADAIKKHDEMIGALRKIENDNAFRLLKALEGSLIYAKMAKLAKLEIVSGMDVEEFCENNAIDDYDIECVVAKAEHYTRMIEKNMAVIG
jgi:hypothetical protein